jgi:hypothetical protein
MKAAEQRNRLYPIIGDKPEEPSQPPSISFVERAMILTRLLFLVLIAFAALGASSRAGEIIEGDTGDAMVTSGAVNSGYYYTLYTLNVGALARNNDVGAIVEAFQLPYLAPGQTVTGATVSFYQQSDGTSPLNTVQLYGLTRVSTSPTILASDWYTGANDTANTLLDSTFTTPSTPTNHAVAYSGGNLASFVQAQYGKPAFSGLALSTARYIFLRLGTNGTQDGTNNYQFASARNPTRAYHPTLALTISGGISKVSGRMQFSFSLPRASITSAGVYNSAGTLVRTLWNSVQYQAGMNYGVWDGNDDSGNPLAPGTNYQIKLIYHNVQYVWNGIVGNTSANQSGANVYRSFLPIEDMSIAGGAAYYSVGYNENENPFHNFTVGQPQVSNEVSFGYTNPGAGMIFVATDGTRSYWASGGGYNDTSTYVMAITCNSQTFYTFPHGTSPGGPNEFASSVDYSANGPAATGLAVQQSGNDLFVSHGSLNLVRVFDKVQGTKLGSFTVSNPGRMQTTANGDVWIISNGTTLRRYTFSGGAATLDRTITGFSGAVGVGVSADDALLLVADSGSSGQIKAFKNSNGEPAWTYGARGGMTVNGPNIASDDFDFTTGTYIAFQSDDTFWIGDQGDSRAEHFSISGGTPTYVEQIAYLGASYQSTVDLTDATRVFNAFFEYSVNYAKPLGGTNGSWSLVKNWAYGLPQDSKHNYFGYAQGWRNVVTLSNGRTYGFLTNFAPTAPTWDLFELPASGPARNTGYSYATSPRLYEDGTLRFNTIGSSLGFYSQPLTGFDAKNNPAWGSPALVASVPLAAKDPVPWVAYPLRTEITASGVAVNFDAYQGDTGYHLSGVSAGAKSWLWRSSASTKSSYSGWFPQNGTFDDGNGVQYAGDYDMALGRNIVYGYHGEFWKDGEASQWINFFDNGLQIGLFGTYNSTTSGADQYASNGFAGNAIAPTLVHAPDGKTYLYHNDEANHGGTIQWLISGWDGIAELNGTAAPGGTVGLSSDAQAPVVRLTSPTAGATYSNGATVFLSASVAGTGVSTSSVQFFDGSVSLGTVDVAPFNLNASSLSRGSHTFTATATASNGQSTTSAAVTATIGSDGLGAVPPTPLSLSSGEVTASSVVLNWTQPTIGTTSSTIGQIISFQFDTSGDSSALTPTETAGAPSYAVSHFNLLGHSDTGTVLQSPVNSAGAAIPNVAVTCAMQYNSNSNSDGSLSGTAAKLLGSAVTTTVSGTTISLGNIPFADYDLVVYSLPGGLNSGSATTSLTVNDNINSSTVTQHFNALPTSYSVADVAFGSNSTSSNANTIVFHGLTSPNFALQGGFICGLQIVERPYNQGVPTSYAIQRGTGGSFSTVGTKTAPALTYTDRSGLHSATVYQYRIQAVNSAGPSPYSNTVSVATPAPTETPSSFASWQAQYFTAAQLANSATSGAQADPYGSGVKNFLAYALQLNPATAQPSDVPQAVLTNGHLAMTYFVPSALTDVGYVVEVSSDMTTWNSGTHYVQVVSNVSSAEGNTITVQDILPSRTNHFMRLRVTELTTQP